MDELTLRFGLVVGALVVAGLATWFLRKRANQPVRSIGVTSLGSGTHLFTSTTCGTCGSARSKLIEVLGAAGFNEHVWEQEPGIFSELGVDAVPAVVVVDEVGHATIYPGQPERALAAL